MLVKKLKAMWQGPPWWQAYVSAAIAIVNVRFFYFKRPGLLAALVAAVTIALTTVLAVVILYQSCTTLRQTVPLPFIEEQMGSESNCKPADQFNAWLKSDWVSYSSGNFSKGGARLYQGNFNNSWGRWGPILQYVASDGFSSDVPRPTAHPLPVGQTRVAVVDDEVGYTGEFTFTDLLSEEVEAQSCPYNAMLNAVRKALGPDGIKAFAQLPLDKQLEALRDYRPKPHGDRDLALFYSQLADIDRKIFTTYLAEDRPLHTIMQVNYTLTPIGSTRQEDLPFSRQTCSWSVCMQRVSLAGVQCRLWDMFAPALDAGNATWASTWAQMIEQLFKQQAPTPVCCQYSATGNDYWCMSPSARAFSTYMGTALSGSSAIGDLTVATPGDAASGFRNSLVQRVSFEMATQIYNWQNRFREACGNDSNAGVWPPGRTGTPSWLRDVDTMERVLHDSMALFMGMATEMLANNAQFHQDLRRGLLTVTLQCEATRCMSVLSVIGVALGYAGWLEMLACFVILSLYLRGRPKERITTSQLMAVITDAPEIPTPGDTIPGHGPASGNANNRGDKGSCPACRAGALDSVPLPLPQGQLLADVAAAPMMGAGSAGGNDSRTSRDSTARAMIQSKAE